MIDEILELLLDAKIEFIYTTRRGPLATLKKAEKISSTFHLEFATNEKIAYELAFAASIMKKRSVFLTSPKNILEALDPVMSTAYMGVVGGMLILALRDTEEDITFLGPFSKIPFIIEGNKAKFQEAINYGIQISEKFEIPVIVELDMPNLNSQIEDERKNISGEKREGAKFVKDTSRWAATPSFRYRLHVLLNEKIKKIREEFESYPGNRCTLLSRTGFITFRSRSLELLEKDFSTLFLSTVYPLPANLVSGFVQKMEEVFVLEDPYSVIDFQLGRRIMSLEGHKGFKGKIPKEGERLWEYEIIRDIYGPSSSMNLAHGIKKLDPKKKILALTYEDNFFHSGIPAFINTLYNDSNYHLLILTSGREDEIIRFMEGLNFRNYHVLKSIEEIRSYEKEEGFTVFILRGTL
jgi:TPP-dependent indolepyruvate ferredoxin oxidoreductase alpha subunit